MRKKSNIGLKYKVPEYFQYLTWYDLDTPLGLYSFIQEMINDNINLEDYPDIKIYYEIIYNNAFSDNPNIITVNYIIKKLKNTLIRYGFAHTSSRLDNKLYYYWFERGD